MKRLLWKEWNEVKWYLLLLAAGPFVVAMVTLITDGFDGHLFNGSISELAGFIFTIFILIIYIWAASRIENGFRSNGFGLDWLPVDSWKVWAVKFLPGFIVAALFPLWMRLSISEITGAYFASDFTTGVTVDYMQYMLVAYTVSFTLAMLFPFALSVVVAVAVTFASLILLPSPWDRTPSPIWENTIFVQIIVVAIAVSIALWFKYLRTDARKKKIAAVIVAVAVYALVGMTSYLKVYYSLMQGIAKRPTHEVLKFDASDPLINTKQASIAYAPKKKKGLNIYINGRTTTLVQADYALPLAWLPDGNLVFATIDSSRLKVNISEWNRKSEKMALLAALPAPQRTGTFSVMGKAIFNADGSRGAVFITPPDGGGSLDLWMLDLTHGGARLVYPGTCRGWQGTNGAWNGDRLIFMRNGAYWSIKYNSKGLKSVRPQRSWWQR